MRLVPYAFGLMLIGIFVGLLVQMLAGIAVMAIGAGLLLVSLIELVDSDIDQRQDDLATRADDVRRQQGLF